MEKEIHSLVVKAEGPNDCYLDITEGIMKKGILEFSRGLETKEIRPVMIIFDEPRQRFLTCPGRKIHPFFQIMEIVWILGGYGGVQWISKYLKNMEKYSDGMPEFHGAYGVRMRHAGYHRDLTHNDFGMGDQFKNCYTYLLQEPDTRHALMTLWNPIFDNYSVKTNDRPCNIALHFLVRDGKLDLTIFNRSNDLHWGLFNTNIVQFSVILETMAMLLHRPMGRQIHMINSLHYYTDNPITQQVLGAGYEYNVYDCYDPYPFYIASRNKEESVEDSLFLLDKDLKEFFEMEEMIWDSANKTVPIPNFRFSFLQDAFFVCESFYFLQHKKYKESLESISKVKAIDIFITCMEYLARSIDGRMILEHVELRLGNISLKKAGDLNETFKYIISH